MSKVEIKKVIQKDFPLIKLKILQKNLKSLSKVNYQKLKKSILENGFFDPILVWQENENNVWILSGTHRVKTLLEMKKENYEVPNNIPCVFVELSSKDEAKLKILAASSQYAEIEAEGLDEFLNSFEEIKFSLEKLQSFKLPNFNIDYFAKSFGRETVLPPANGIIEPATEEQKEKLEKRDQETKETLNDNQDETNLIKQKSEKKELSIIAHCKNEKEQELVFAFLNQNKVEYEF